jgi:hypothetical protein
MNSLEDVLFNLKQGSNKHKKLSDFDLDIDSDDLKAQVKMKDLENKRYASDTLDRKWLAIWTAIIVSVWLYFVLIILTFNRIICLSDSVLITLLGTTTLNVLGLSFIVLKGHFNSSKL